MSLPAHVYAVKDRHGKIRYRFRKRGLPSRYVHGAPGTSEFSQSYESCFDPTVRPGKREKRVRVTYLRGESVVYFAGIASGEVKIGTSVNLYERLKKLQTGTPAKLTLLAVVKSDATTEAEYHRRFAAHHIHGEWFRGKPIREEIKRLNKLSEFPTYYSRKVSNPIRPPKNGGKPMILNVGGARGRSDASVENQGSCGVQPCSLTNAIPPSPGAVVSNLSDAIPHSGTEPRTSSHHSLSPTDARTGRG